MKTHQQIRDWLGGYVLGDLDETQARAVQSHVTQCPDCQAELAGLQRLLDLSRERHALQADDALIQRAQQRLRRTLEAEPVAVMNPWRKIMNQPPDPHRRPRPSSW